MTVEPRLVDIAATAAYLGTTERHIRELVYTRRIPFVKIGRALRFDVRDLDRWIDINKTKAAS